MLSSLMDQLHKQEFTLLLVNVPSYVMQTHFYFYVLPSTKAWLLVYLNIFSTHLSSTHFFYSISYLYWYITSYICASFMILMWSYHWWFMYLFIMLFMWEWTHYNSWYVLKYCCNYCNKKWNSHIEKCFSPFLLPHIETNGYCHHQKWSLNF